MHGNAQLANLEGLLYACSDPLFLLHCAEMLHMTPTHISASLNVHKGPRARGSMQRHTVPPPLRLYSKMEGGRTHSVPDDSVPRELAFLYPRKCAPFTYSSSAAC